MKTKPALSFRRLCKMPPISNPARISCASAYYRSVRHIGREFCKLFARHSTRATHGSLALNSKCITRLQPPPEGKKRTAFRCTMSGALKLVAQIPNHQITELIAQSAGLLWAVDRGKSIRVLVHDEMGKQDGFYKIDLTTGQ